MQQKPHDGEYAVAIGQKNKDEITDDFYDIIRSCIETEKLPWEDIQILIKIAENLKLHKNEIAQIKKKLDSSRSNGRYLTKELNYYKDKYLNDTRKKSKEYREIKNKYIELINEDVNQQKRNSNLKKFLNKQMNNYNLLYEDFVLKNKQLETLQINYDKILTELKVKKGIIDELNHILDKQRTKIHFLCYLIIFAIVIGLLFLTIDFGNIFKSQAETFQTTDELITPLEKLVNILTGGWLKYLSVIGLFLFLLLYFYKGNDYEEHINVILKMAIIFSFIVSAFSLAITFLGINV